MQNICKKYFFIIKKLENQIKKRGKKKKKKKRKKRIRTIKLNKN